MAQYPKPLARLIDELVKLPGVGPKTAERLAFFIIDRGEDAARLAQALTAARRQLKFCPVCFNFASGNTCDICADARRDHHQVCVVAEAKDIVSIEKSGQFGGVYHVLHGVLAPMDGIGPEQLKIKELLARLQRNSISEVILATNPNVEGESTAMYLAKLLKPMGVKVTRLASGLPVGAELEYADEVTVGRALEGRREM